MEKISNKFYILEIIWFIIWIIPTVILTTIFLFFVGVVRLLAPEAYKVAMSSLYSVLIRFKDE